MLAAADVGVAAPLSIMFRTNEKKKTGASADESATCGGVCESAPSDFAPVSSSSNFSLSCGGHVGCVLLLLHFSLSALLRTPPKIDFQEVVRKRHTANMLHTHTQTRSASLFPNNKHLTIWKHRNLILLSNAFTGTTPNTRPLELDVSAQLNFSQLPSHPFSFDISHDFPQQRQKCPLSVCMLTLLI